MSSTLTTAQDVFNGPGFNGPHMLNKADRELHRLLQADDPMIAYDHMFNFVVTMAAVADWTFHLQLKPLSLWAGKKEQHFTNWVRHANDDAFVLIDLSNEYKHADRNKPSSLAQKMWMKTIWQKDDPQLSSRIDRARMLWFETTSGGIAVIPWIDRHSGDNDFFVDIGRRAIAWWKNFNPANAVPMDAAGNPA